MFKIFSFKKSNLCFYFLLYFIFRPLVCRTWILWHAYFLCFLVFLSFSILLIINCINSGRRSLVVSVQRVSLLGKGLPVPSCRLKHLSNNAVRRTSLGGIGKLPRIFHPQKPSQHGRFELSLNWIFFLGVRTYTIRCKRGKQALVLINVNIWLFITEKIEEEEKYLLAINFSSMYIIKSLCLQLHQLKGSKLHILRGFYDRVRKPIFGGHVQNFWKY